MKSITLIIFLAICTTSYGLSCITTNDGEPLERSLRNFDCDALMSEVEKLPINEDDDDSICRVELYINYDKQLLTVTFTEHLEDSSLEDQYVQIDIFVDGDEIEGIGVHHLLEYACSDDECEKNFIEKYIDWFVQGDYAALQKQLVPLILGNGEELRQCFDLREEPEECSSGQCLAKVVGLENVEPLVFQYCVDDDEPRLVGLHFILDFDLKFENINLQWEFYCEYDQCNNENNTNEVVTIFNEEYDKESVLKRFGYKSKDRGEEPEPTTSSTKSSISSSSQQTANSVQSTSFTNLVQSTTATNLVQSTTVTNPVQSASVTNLVQSTTATNPVQSTTVTNPNNDTITTTTIKTNNGMHIQSTNAIIYVALIAFMYRFIFLA